ncbi:MAG: hypothetical protein JSR45_16550 [Proteobacteria bacterium]|nr:hypothetical protein [Pseudomonadota bacterium]
MTGWMIVGVIVLVVLVLVYGPVDVRVTLDRPFLVRFRVSYFGVPVAWGPRVRPLTLPRGSPKAGKKRRRKGGLMRLIGTLAKLRELKPLLDVARVEGAPRYLWENGRLALSKVRLVRARLVLSLWLPDPSANAWLFAFLAWAQPRIGSGRSCVEIAFAPDPLQLGLGAEGEMVLRTRPAFWLAFGFKLLTDRVTWRLLHAMRRARRGD